MQTSNNCSMSMTVFPVLIALSTGLLLLITTISPSNQQEASVLEAFVILAAKNATK